MIKHQLKSIISYDYIQETGKAFVIFSVFSKKQQEILKEKL